MLPKPGLEPDFGYTYLAKWSLNHVVASCQILTKDIFFVCVSLVSYFILCILTLCTFLKIFLCNLKNRCLFYSFYIHL